MQEGEPENPYFEQILLRIQEENNKITLERTFGFDKYKQILRDALEDPTEENFRKIVADIFRTGIQAGSSVSSVAWADSLTESDIAPEKILGAWNEADESIRNILRESGLL